MKTDESKRENLMNSQSEWLKKKGTKVYETL
jgi:hypothetical protein